MLSVQIPFVRIQGSQVNSRFTTHGQKWPLGSPGQDRLGWAFMCSGQGCLPLFSPSSLGFTIIIRPLNASLREWVGSGQTQASIKARWPFRD